MVQVRLLTKTHPDEHFTAALFKYFNEFATKLPQWHVWMTNVK